MLDRSKVRRVVDPLTAVALLAAGLYALGWVPRQESGFAAPRPVDAAFLLLVSLPLAWRRRAPLLTFAVVLTSAWLWLLLWYRDAPQPPFEPALALWLATYSAAALRGRTPWVVGAAVAAMLVSTDVPALLEGRPVGNVLPSWVLFALSFAVGRSVGRHEQQKSAMAERAAQAEAGREEQARRAVAAERARIARELHDVITHAVSVMVVQAAAEARVLPPAAAATGTVLHDIETTGREALVELRRLLGVLRKPDTDGDRHPQPTLGDLDGLLDTARSSGLPIRVNVVGEPRPLPASVDLCAFRVVQEALTNVRKHAGSVPADLTLRYCPDALVVEVINDTVPAPREHAPGYGLLGLRERIDLHGGTLEAGPEPGGHYKLLARLPCGRGSG